MNYNAKDEELIKKYPHFERMLDEYFELSTKIEKLNEFFTTSMFSKLSEIEKDLLTEQGEAMNKYLEILNKRIEYIREKK